MYTIKAPSVNSFNATYKMFYIKITFMEKDQLKKNLNLIFNFPSKISSILLSVLHMRLTCHINILNSSGFYKLLLKYDNM